ncbi:class I SAM-dependent methyltransferase [Magnetovibrio sp. PR-2]|uniref:class I SAM-dependent methyltransferase n=1 Tax=Magnetovibrio sp. PR-2 TaxID=3120356 RepID=UPI002FCE5E57
MPLRDHYDAHVLPHLIDVAMRAPMASREREQLIPQASGSVLEIGAGSGLNMPHYSAEVTHLLALEPNHKLRAKAARKAGATSFPVEFISLKGEDLSLEAASVDTIVTTWTLCSIADVEKALAGMFRVLKPGGQLLFVEHGRAPTERLARWQDRLTPAWSCFAGGCRLNRRPDQLIAEAGFEIEQMEQGFLDGPKLLTYHYKGLARRA